MPIGFEQKLLVENYNDTNIGPFIHAFTQMYINNVTMFFKRPLFDINLPFLAPNLLRNPKIRSPFFVFLY